MAKAPSGIQHANGEVTEDALKLTKSFDDPPGYGLSLGGAGQDQEELFTEMLIALLSGIGLMYLILVTQFGSFTAPLAVMLSWPLSLIGVVLALLDAARKREAAGFEREEVLLHARQMRLRPILMTTFALDCRQLPVALGLGEGREFYQPPAMAIISGTMTSTLLFMRVLYCGVGQVFNRRGAASS